MLIPTLTGPACCAFSAPTSIDSDYTSWTPEDADRVAAALVEFYDKVVPVKGCLAFEPSAQTGSGDSPTGPLPDNFNSTLCDRYVREQLITGLIRIAYKKGATSRVNIDEYALEPWQTRYVVSLAARSEPDDALANLAAVGTGDLGLRGYYAIEDLLTTACTTRHPTMGTVRSSDTRLNAVLSLIKVLTPDTPYAERQHVRRALTARPSIFDDSRVDGGWKMLRAHLDTLDLQYPVKPRTATPDPTQPDSGQTDIPGPGDTTKRARAAIDWAGVGLGALAFGLAGIAAAILARRLNTQSAARR